MSWKCRRLRPSNATLAYDPVDGSLTLTTAGFEATSFHLKYTARD